MGSPGLTEKVACCMASPEAQALLQDPAVDEANWGFQIQQAVEKA